MSDESTAPARTWPIVVTLKHPIEYGSEQISSLSFRRGRLGDLKGVGLDGSPPVEKVLVIASRLCGKTPEVLERLDQDDCAEVLAIAMSFFATCLGAGETA